MLVTRGAYGEVGSEEFCAGAPRPVKPDTLPTVLCLVEGDIWTVGRLGRGGIAESSAAKFEAEFEDVSWGDLFSCPPAEFKVEVEGVEPVASLLEEDPSVDLLVLKLALERRRRSLRNEGAMMYVDIWAMLGIDLDGMRWGHGRKPYPKRACVCGSWHFRGIVVVG